MALREKIKEKEGKIPFLMHEMLTNWSFSLVTSLSISNYSASQKCHKTNLEWERKREIRREETTNNKGFPGQEKYDVPI